MKIQVTQENIDRGIRRNCGFCPIANALFDATGEWWMVDGNHAHLRRRMIELPTIATDFIDDFDSGAPVEPVEFDLPIEEG